MPKPLKERIEKMKRAMAPGSIGAREAARLRFEGSISMWLSQDTKAGVFTP
jgi:hypothetical protein